MGHKRKMGNSHEQTAYRNRASTRDAAECSGWLYTLKTSALLFNAK